MKGGSGGSQTPPNNQQTSQPHPFAFAAVQDYLRQAQEVAGREYTPYSGQRVADLTPTHDAALAYGRNAMGSTLPGAENVINQFAHGQHNQPAYIHPFLSGGVGAAAPNNFFYPFPWGNTGSGQAGGDPSAGSGSPAPMPAPSIPSAMPPQLAAPPAGLSALGGAPKAGGGTAGGGIAMPYGNNGQFFEGANYGNGGGAASDTTRWHQFLGIPYGTGEQGAGIYNVDSLGAMYADPANPPSVDEMINLYARQEQAMGNNAE